MSQKKDFYDDDYTGQWECECTFYDDNLAQLFSRSPRGRKEFPGLEVGNRVAIAVARAALSPLVELCGAWTVASEVGTFGIETLYINLHPMQKMLPKAKLLKEYERVLCDCVAQVGVNMQVEREVEYCLQFVPGFGPRKSQMFRNNLKSSAKPIMQRQDIIMEKSLGIGTKVFENACAYLKLWDRHDFEVEYEDERKTLFDTTRIHPETYVTFEWAAKMCADALSEDNDLVSLSPNARVHRIMDNSALQIAEHYNEQKDKYYKDFSNLDDFRADEFDPFATVPEDNWKDRIGDLDLEAYAKMLKDQIGGVTKRETLEVIKRELRWAFRDPRKVTRQLSSRPTKPEDQVRLFELLTGETDLSLRPGKELVGVISSPGEHGVRLRFYNGLQGFAHKSKLIDDAIVDDVEIRDEFKRGKIVRCVILEVKKEHMSLDVSLKASDLEKPSTKWPRPDGLPPLDTFFDKNAADAIIEKTEAESRQQAIYAMAAHSKGSADGNASAVVTPLAPGVVRRGNIKRACKHPSFRNATWKGIKKELDEMGQDAVGHCLIHPSSEDADKLTLTWCLDQNLYKNFQIQEVRCRESRNAVLKRHDVISNISHSARRSMTSQPIPRLVPA